MNSMVNDFSKKKQRQIHSENVFPGAFTLKTFSAFFFAQPIVQVFCSLKTPEIASLNPTGGVTFFARNHEHLHNKTVDNFFQELVLHILCKLLCNNILLMHRTYRPSTFIILSENMKISK